MKAVRVVLEPWRQVVSSKPSKQTGNGAQEQTSCMADQQQDTVITGSTGSAAWHRGVTTLVTHTHTLL